MILDCDADHDHARRFRLIDSETGAEIDSHAVFYADDEAGFFLRYDEGFPPDPQDPTLTARHRVDRKVLIVPKSGT